MNDGYRSTHTVETFQQAVSAIPAMRTQTDSTFSNRNISNNMATVSGHLTTPGGDVPLTVELTGFGNSWSIVTVTAGGATLQ